MALRMWIQSRGLKERIFRERVIYRQGTLGKKELMEQKMINWPESQPMLGTATDSTKLLE